MLLIRWEGLGSFISTCAMQQHEEPLWCSPSLAGPEPDPLPNPEHNPRSGSSPGCRAPSSRRSTARVASRRTGSCTTFTRTCAARFQTSRHPGDPGWHGEPRAAHTQRIRRRSCGCTYRYHATPGQPAAEHAASVRQPWSRLVRAGANGRGVLCNPAAIRSCITYGVERRCGATCSEQHPRAGRRGGSVQRGRVPGAGRGGAPTKHPLEGSHMPVWLSPPLFSSRSLVVLSGSLRRHAHARLLLISFTYTWLHFLIAIMPSDCPCLTP